MTCEMAVERLLEADPRELRGEVKSELTEHIAECARCARVAAILVADLDGLEAGLAAHGAGGDSGAAAERALAAVREMGGSRLERESRPGRESEGSRRRAASWAWVPLTAAAALAGLLLLGRGGADPGIGTHDPSIAGAHDEPDRPARVAVVPPWDRGAAVLETANPKITIIWLYEREES